MLLHKVYLTKIKQTKVPALFMTLFSFHSLKYLFKYYVIFMLPADKLTNTKMITLKSHFAKMHAQETIVCLILRFILYNSYTTY